MDKHPILNWPIVTAENCFQVVRDSGIVPWPKLDEPVPIATFLANANDSQLLDYNRFAPKSFAITHQNVFDGSTFNAFRTDFKPFSLVFLFVDNYVAVTAEWKHGNSKITIVPVCGAPGKEEAHITDMSKKMKAAAVREVHEETGLTVDNITALAGEHGRYFCTRNSESRYFPYVAEVGKVAEKVVTKFDSTEHLTMLLFTLPEWIRLIEGKAFFDKNQDFGLEDCVLSSTYAALRHLGKMKIDK